MKGKIPKPSNLPYYTFYEDEWIQKLEGRYWNPQGHNICIIAILTKGVAWAAYIGASPNTSSERASLVNVASWGAKLSVQDANYFFPEIKLPYRY